MSNRVRFALLAVVLVFGGAYLYVWPWVEVALDPNLKRAESARAVLRLGYSQRQVLGASLPFLDGGPQGGLTLSGCADPALIVWVRFKESGVIRHLARRRMQATDSSFATMASLCDALAQDTAAATCATGNLSFGVWDIRLDFSRGVVTSIGDVEYGG